MPRGGFQGALKCKLKRSVRRILQVDNSLLNSSINRELHPVGLASINASANCLSLAVAGLLRPDWNLLRPLEAAARKFYAAGCECENRLYGSRHDTIVADECERWSVRFCRNVTEKTSSGFFDRGALATYSSSGKLRAWMVARRQSRCDRSCHTRFGVLRGSSPIAVSWSWIGRI